MLEINGLSVCYGAIRALHAFSCRVGEGEIVALIGSNGAGKSTTLNAVSGIVPASGGSISFKGEEIRGIAPHRIVRLGISQVPEGRRVFGRMSVLENLEMGGYTLKERKHLKEGMERVFTLFPRLAERRSQPARTLSGGEQQMLAMGRALVAEPQLLLLDEPSMGLAPLLVEKVFETIVEINRMGTTIVLVEQNAHMALAIASRAYVLESGEIVLEGSSADLAVDPAVQRAYLGGAA